MTPIAGLPLFPAAASTMAPRVDAAVFFLIGLTAFFSLLVAGAIVVLGVRYHHGRRVDRTNPPAYNLTLEILWSGIPLALVILLFFWGARLYVDAHLPPANARTVFVIGKQWMWKVEHPQGQREINELHVPVGEPIRLMMTSQDVIHDFFIPEFRVKQDVVPGRYTFEWFQATRPGTYHIFCAQYCGTNHSAMVGRVVAMMPRDFQRWMGSGIVGGMAGEGSQLFHQYGCISCHRTDSWRRGPTLTGLYGSPVHLNDGRTVTADDAYIRESILKPSAKVVQGFENIMPTFQGQISEEEVLRLIAYIKSLKGNTNE